MSSFSFHVKKQNFNNDVALIGDNRLFLIIMD